MAEVEAPTLFVFAGPNGSGKSTLYRRLLIENDALNGLPFLNAYEISSDENIDRYEAANHVMDEADRFISEGTSFCWETVFSLPVKADYLQYAKTCGYSVVLFALATNHPDINIEKVSERVAQAGHDVSREKILWRWESFTSVDLYRVLNYVTEAYLFNFDGSDITEFGTLNLEGTYSFNNPPEWFKPY